MNELTSGYLKHIKTATTKHLKKIGEKTNYHDVVKHLDDAGLTNHRISGHTQFIDLVEQHVTDHTASIDLSGPSPPKQKRTKKQFGQHVQDKALAQFAYLRENIHLHSIKYDRAYVVGQLKEKQIIDTQSQLSPRTIHAMDALIHRHNAKHHRENIKNGKMANMSTSSQFIV